MNKSKYAEWISAEQMHEDSKEWLSELLFIKDEHLFFDDLIKSFTLQLLEPEKFSDNIEIIDILNKSEKRNNLLIEAIRVHENDLQIIVDGVNQINEEKVYKKSHQGLLIKIREFENEYRNLKTQLFEIIKNIKKEDKRNRLLEDK
ncbi:hypothetical protein [Winogradskyella ludwigii]|jgi:hypothetical protein|uniref:hypothetical protein n=1 Tax=Winogradskyella ludwigii TaxID=2686076 RepID=UPI0015C84DC8|nr:hypothetical protein [Winogradskyella ludwigii]